MLLDVSDLTVTFRTNDGPVHAVNGLSFAIDEGETLAIVGESGSGKSMTALSIMGLLARGARSSGQILLDGTDILTTSEPDLCKMRGNTMGMVFQEPMTALNPVQTLALIPI